MGIYMCEKKYVSDVIGDEYTEWVNLQIILINAPTGSGKSYFIFNKLLDFAINNSKRILYLVNRKVLKLQLDEEYISGNRASLEYYKKYDSPFLDIKNFIQIQTYQSVEKRLINCTNINEHCNIWNELRTYDYIVYDECHYFYSDSNFNTYTQISYSFLRNVFYDKIQIFISATLDNMRNYIIGFVPILLNNNPMINNAIFAVSNNYRLAESSNKFKEYSIPCNYDYIDIYTFDDLPALITTIGNKTAGNKNEKWLIFTDSIRRSNYLKNILKALEISVRTKLS